MEETFFDDDPIFTNETVIPSILNQRPVDKVHLQHVEDLGIFSSLLVTFLGTILLGIFFEFARTRLPNVYEAIHYNDNVVDPPPRKPFAWIFDLWWMDERKIYMDCGLDALTYIRFLKTNIAIISVVTVFGFLLIAPVNATASNKQLPKEDPDFVSGSAIFSIENIAPGSLRFSAHIISVFFNTAVTCYMLYMNYKLLLSYRLLHKMSPFPQNWTVMVREIPESLSSDAKLMHYFDSLWPHQVIAVKTVQTSPKLDAILEERLETITHLERGIAVYRDKGIRPRERIPRLVGESVDVIDFYRKKMIRVDRLWQYYHSQMHHQTNVAFVTFRTTSVASKCAQVKLNRYPLSLVVEPAPDPNAILWSNLDTTYGGQLFRIILSYGLAYLMVTFWLVPVGFFSSVSNLDYLTDKLSSLQWFHSYQPAQKAYAAIIEGILPSIFVIMFLAMLERIIWFLVSIQKLFTRMEVDKTVFAIYFLFQLFNVFFGVLIQGSAAEIFDRIVAVAESPYQLILLLADAIPHQIDFYMSYVMLSALTSVIFFLIRPDQLFWKCIWSYWAVSTRDKEKLNAPPEFRCSNPLAKDLIVGMIVNVYSSLSPLILPLGLFYFAVSLIIANYNYSYVYRPKYEGGGHLWTALFHRMMFGLLLYQVTILGVLSLKVKTAGLIVIPIFATLLYWYFLSQHMERQFYFGALDESGQQEIPFGSEKAYVNPSFLPNDDKIKEDYGGYVVLDSLEENLN